MDTELENLNQDMRLKVHEEKFDYDQPRFENVENTPCCENTDSCGENTDSYIEIDIDENEHLEKGDFHSQKIDDLHHKIDTGLQKIMQQAKYHHNQFENDKSCFENVHTTPSFENTVSNVHSIDNHPNNIETPVRNIKQELGASNESYGNLQSCFVKNHNIYIFENTNSESKDKDNADYGMCVDIMKIKQKTEDYHEQISELENKEYPKDVKNNTQLGDLEQANKRNELTVKPGSIDLIAGICNPENSHDSNIDAESSYANIEFNLLKSENETTTNGKSDTMLTHSASHPNMVAMLTRTDVHPHLNTVTPPLFKCSLCGEEFTKSRMLKKHKKITHRTERPHQCNMCDKQFKRSNHLRLHMTTHTNYREYQCNICDKGFKRRPDLTRHMVTHNTERPHHCDICDKGFKALRYLKKHQNSQH